MGQGKEVKTRPDPQVEIQERGEIFFFYTPKVNKEEAQSVDDVQRLYIVMRPESGETPVEEKQEHLSGKEGSIKDSKQTLSLVKRVPVKTSNKTLSLVKRVPVITPAKEPRVVAPAAPRTEVKEVTALR